MLGAQNKGPGGLPPGPLAQTTGCSLTADLEAVPGTGALAWASAKVEEDVHGADGLVDDVAAAIGYPGFPRQPAPPPFPGI
jgi:hypothetical protein